MDDGPMDKEGRPTPVPTVQPIVRASTPLTNNNTQNDTTSKPRQAATSPPRPGHQSTYPHWDDVDLTVQGNCGWHKCFFPSRRNATLGYLVTKEKEYLRIQSSLALAPNISDMFGAQHLYLDASLDVVSNEFKDYINSLVVQPSRTLNKLPIKPILHADQKAAILRVLKAPQPTLFFGATWVNCDVMVKQLHDFTRQVPNATTFAQQVMVEVERMRQVLHYNQIIAHDFQGLIDVHGNFYYVDLEGAEKQYPAPLSVINHAIHRLEQVRDTIVARNLGQKAPKINCH